MKSVWHGVFMTIWLFVIEIVWASVTVAIGGDPHIGWAWLLGGPLYGIGHWVGSASEKGSDR